MSLTHHFHLLSNRLSYFFSRCRLCRICIKATSCFLLILSPFVPPRATLFLLFCPSLGCRWAPSFSLDPPPIQTLMSLRRSAERVAALKVFGAWLGRVLFLRSVSHRICTTKTWLRSWTRPCEVCEQRGNLTDFSPITSNLPCQNNYINSPQSSSS